MEKLILHPTFEDIASGIAASELQRKLMEFVLPLPDVEANINVIADSLSNSGKLLFLLGRPGTGKSTFVESLSWRPHIKISSLIHLNATEHTLAEGLSELYKKIKSYSSQATEKKEFGPLAIVINYLEYLDDFEEKEIRGFFMRLNGLLRTVPLLIIWPVTAEGDVNNMLDYSKDVSGTIFYRGKEVINFAGPPLDKFVDIIKTTIAVLNDGKELTDFALTHDDLVESFVELNKLPQPQRTIREYIELCKARWTVATEYEVYLNNKIPKPTEVWFVFSYKNAESVISQFIRKSPRVEDAWSTIHDKFYEYIHSSQRSAVWDAKRLQLALNGALKTRVVFLPTNTMISILAAYSDNVTLKKILGDNNVPERWYEKKAANESFKKSPLVKQLLGETFHVGMRKGGPAADALIKAEPAYASITQWISGGGSGSDKSLNSCVGEAIKMCTGFDVACDKMHPWIPDVIPDILIELPHKQICLEFHYTNRDEPNVVADYVLKKLHIYMNQLESLLKK